MGRSLKGNFPDVPLLSLTGGCYCHSRRSSSRFLITLLSIWFDRFLHTLIFSRLLRPWIQRFTTWSTILVAQRRFSHARPYVYGQSNSARRWRRRKRYTKYANHPLGLLLAVVLTVYVYKLASLVSGCFWDPGFTSSVFDWR